jgi:hypothetical protein
VEENLVRLLAEADLLALPAVEVTVWEQVVAKESQHHSALE